MPNIGDTTSADYMIGDSLMFERICWCSVTGKDNIHYCKRPFSELLDHLSADIFSDAPHLKSKWFLDMCCVLTPTGN